jgi:hypothetical protein
MMAWLSDIRGIGMTVAEPSAEFRRRARCRAGKGAGGPALPGTIE